MTMKRILGYIQLLFNTFIHSKMGETIQNVCFSFISYNGEQLSKSCNQILAFSFISEIFLHFTQIDKPNNLLKISYVGFSFLDLHQMVLNEPLSIFFPFPTFHFASDMGNMKGESRSLVKMSRIQVQVKYIRIAAQTFFHCEKHDQQLTVSPSQPLKLMIIVLSRQLVCPIAAACLNMLSRVFE